MKTDRLNLTPSELDRLIRFWLDMENSAFWAVNEWKRGFATDGFYKTCKANRKFAQQQYRRKVLGYGTRP